MSVARERKSRRGVWKYRKGRERFRIGSTSSCSWSWLDWMIFLLLLFYFLSQSSVLWIWMKKGGKDEWDLQRFQIHDRPRFPYIRPPPFAPWHWRRLTWFASWKWKEVLSKAIDLLTRRKRWKEIKSKEQEHRGMNFFSHRFQASYPLQLTHVSQHDGRPLSSHIVSIEFLPAKENHSNYFADFHSVHTCVYFESEVMKPN